MIRFNKEGKFNLPVGNVDFNKNVFTSITYYLDFVRANQIEFTCLDYKEFIDKMNIKKEDYIYFDPPYLISQSEYNKLWNDEKEMELLTLIDELDKKGIRFGITNLVYHKGYENSIFKHWAQKYYIYDINSNYISYHDNTIKNNSQEVFVTNYGKS